MAQRVWRHHLSMPGTHEWRRTSFQTLGRAAPYRTFPEETKWQQYLHLYQIVLELAGATIKERKT